MRTTHVCRSNARTVDYIKCCTSDVVGNRVQPERIDDEQIYAMNVWNQTLNV
jgi:hypothetical protein